MHLTPHRRRFQLGLGEMFLIITAWALACAMIVTPPLLSPSLFPPIPDMSFSAAEILVRMFLGYKLMVWPVGFIRGRRKQGK